MNENDDGDGEGDGDRDDDDDVFATCVDLNGCCRHQPFRRLLNLALHTHSSTITNGTSLQQRFRFLYTARIIVFEPNPCVSNLHYRVLPIALWAEPETKLPRHNCNVS